MKVLFTGRIYRSPDLTLTEPGEYDVSEAKGAQLVRDFPDTFESGEGPTIDSVASKSTSKSKKSKGGETVESALDAPGATPEQTETGAEARPEVSAEPATQE